MLSEYPLVQVEKIDAWPENVEGLELEFRLTYKGRLPAVSGSDRRVDDKHRIRKEIHKQLCYLIETNRVFSRAIEKDPTLLGRAGDRFARCGFRFIPIVGDGPSACALDILFLRRDQPGNLITHRGDIDNRIKVLFDALQIPDNYDQLPKGAKPDVGEDPMFCLLFNDRLISEVKVTTDQLLSPPEPGESVNDVQLVIGVRTIHPSGDEYQLLG